jgi:dATP pyrophosphohydrolase
MGGNGDVPIKSFVVSVYVCRKARGRGRYLILKRKSRYMFGLWQQISGKIRKGEKAWEAALREIQEETGIVPESLYSVDIVESFYEVNQNCVNIIPVFVAFVSGNPEIKLSREHSEFKWITAREADRFLTFPQQKSSILIIEREFVKNKPPDMLKINFDGIPV